MKKSLTIKYLHYIYVNIVVCHPMKNIISDIEPRLVGAEDDEEGYQCCKAGDYRQQGYHLDGNSI